MQRLKRDSLCLLRTFNLNKTELSLLLVNDSRMKALNHSYRGISRTTDVLSFPIYNSLKEIPKERETLIGDIIISLPAAERQAADAGSTFYGEVRRLLVHGFLHLIGYDHEKTTARKRTMTRKEISLLQHLYACDISCKIKRYEQ